MTEEKPEAEQEPTLVEKWVKDQQDWQRTWMEYFDSMVKNDDFLVHLGNAMRGSLLAGKPYPGTEPPETDAEPADARDERFDQILHVLNRLQGEVADLKMSVADLGAKLDKLARLKSAEPATPPVSAAAQPQPAVTPDPVPQNPAASSFTATHPEPAQPERGEG